MRTLKNGLLVVTLMTALLVTTRSQAVVYQVNRSFTNGTSTATLTGTVSVPLGNYVIQNTAPNPFTAVNLTLNVDASSYNLTNSLTSVITGSGQFVVNANPTTLTFSASGNGSNPADLVFSDNLDPFSVNRYAIGSNGSPNFQTAITAQGTVLANVQFPVPFGAAVPEPASITLFAAAMAGLGMRRRRTIGFSRR